ncbi:MAG: hypothetical protein E6J42_09905 [Chloroflexi bacterium]|nr:MAG: hypothetical protein E6J42_09905 [Chloroflexota bacterium]
MKILILIAAGAIALSLAFSHASGSSPAPGVVSPQDAAGWGNSNCDILHGVCVALTPNDPQYGSQYGPQEIHAPQAWDLTTGATSTVIAIVDTGIDCTHSDIAGKCMVGYDFVNIRPLTGTENSDDFGHGTHVACIAACQTNNSMGVAGMCWQCIVMPVKVLNSGGSGTFGQVAQGITFAADHGANIINMSLGGCPSGNLGDCGMDPAVESAMSYAQNKGVLIVAALANTGAWPLYPGTSQYTIGVSAVDSFGNIANFSSVGRQEFIVKGKTMLSAPGVSVLAAVPTGTCSLCDPTGYRTLSGTSMATPHVAASAGLIWAQFGNAGAVHAALTGHADDMGSPGYDMCYGIGRVNPYRALSGTAQVDTGGIMEQQCLPSANDNFAAAAPIALGGRSSPWVMANTTEAGEPISCNGYSASAWWKFNPVTDADVEADSFGTSGEMDTVLSVYTGTALNSLTLLGCNDDFGGQTSSVVSWHAVVGVTYWIQETGWAQNYGEEVLNLGLTNSSPKPTPSPTPTASPTPTPTPIATATPTPTASPTPTIAPTPTPTPAPTPTPCPKFNSQGRCVGKGH